MIHTAYFTVGAGIYINGVSYVNGFTRAYVSGRKFLILPIILLNAFVFLLQRGGGGGK